MKSVIIYTNEPFPEGGAATSRILSYSYGLLANDIHVKVLCTKSSLVMQPEIIAKNYMGYFNGIYYQYTNKNVCYYPNKRYLRLGKWLNRFHGILGALSYIRHSDKTATIGVISYCHGFEYELPLVFTCKIACIPVLKEESEHPELRAVQHNFILGKLYLGLMYHLYSGIICMTTSIHSFFIQRGYRSERLLFVPQTINAEIINNTYATLNGLPHEYIAYSGSYNQPKDGVITILKAFKGISTDYPNLCLVLSGEPKGQESKVFWSAVTDLGVNDRVKVLGWLSKPELVYMLRNAKLLISLRPKNPRTEFSFPMKVAEYLSCGVPVVTTMVGDLNKYLIDSENAFIVEESDLGGIINKILWILGNYERALSIAKNGKILAFSAFNPAINTKTIINWFTDHES